MKPLFFIILILLACLPLMAASQTTNAILISLGPLIVAIVAPLITRLFRKIGIDINDSLIEPILMRIIEIIAQVEKENTDSPGVEKKGIVTYLARSILSKAHQSLLIKKYGSLDTAVQAAFERSSIALK